MSPHVLQGWISRKESVRFEAEKPDSVRWINLLSHAGRMGLLLFRKSVSNM